MRATLTRGLCAAMLWTTPAAMAQAPPVDPEAQAALCADAPPADRAACEEICTAWPADTVCVALRRWGVAGMNVIVRVGQHGQTWEQALAEEGLDAAAGEKLRIYADYASFVAGPWNVTPPVDGALAETAQRGMAALQRGAAAARSGDAEAAVKAFAEAAAAMEAAYGADNQTLATTLSNLGQVLGTLYRWDEARAALERAHRIRLTAYPPRHPNLALIEMGFASVDAATGDAAKSAERLTRAHTALTDVLGPDHPQTLTAANNLAIQLSNRDQNEAALALLQHLVRARRVLTGPTSPDTLTAEGNLATTLLSLARHDDARTLLAGTLARAEARFGPDHPEVGSVVFNLARAHQAAGALDEAHAGMRRAVALFSAGGRRYARDAASAQVGLADILVGLGDLPAALALYGEALKTRVELLGAEHPDSGDVWARIAAVQLALGMTKEAGEQALIGLAYAVKQGAPLSVIGRRRAEYAAVMARAGDLEAAEGHYRRAREELLTASGADHPDVVAVEGSLGGVLAERGKLDEARPLVARTLERLVKSRGETSASALNTAWTLATIDAMRGDQRSALALASRVSRAGWARFATLAAAAPNPVALHGALEELRPIIALERDMLLASGDAKGALDAALRAHGAGARGERVWRAAHGEDDARELAAARAALAPSRAALCKALKKERGALVLFAGVDDLRAPAAGTTAPRRTGAFVVSEACKVAWVDLGDAPATMAAVTAWRDGLDGARDCYAKRADAAFCAKTFAAADAHGEALRRAVWDPVAAALGKARRAWIVADGALTRVAFDALPADGGGYLLETWELAYAVGPEALLAAAGVGARGQGALVVGDLDFSAAAPDATQAAAMWRRCAGGRCEAPAGGEAAGPQLASLRAGGGAAACGYDVTWSALLDTEARQVATALGGLGVGEAWLVDGRAAEEESIRRSVGGKRVLHLATHGFFAPPDVCAEHSLAGGRREGFAAVALEGAGREAIIDPLRLSGVALSGANARRGAGAPPAGDGLLSAREIAGLDLRGTALVALSACETGLGVAVTGESFSGLVGAFLGAGAERAIVSLWQVPSVTTAELFEGFYAAFAEGKGDRPWARFRETRRALVRDLAADGVPHSAFLWGAFVPVTGVTGGW